MTRSIAADCRWPQTAVPLAAAILAATALAWSGAAPAQTVITPLAAPSAAPATPSATLPALSGTATYLERMALPENAAFEATVRDVTRPDLPAELIGRTRIQPVQGLPIRFAIPYDPRLVQYGHRYTLQARIIADGRLLFATVDPVPVFIDGQPAPVDIVLPRGTGLAMNELPAPTATARPAPVPYTPAPVPYSPGPVPTMPGLGTLPATYEGVLPCADCAGIRHTLLLDPAGPFTLHIEYLGKRGEPGYDLTGRWLYDADARVLTLSSDRERPIAFAVRDSATLRLLDAAGQTIVSNLNYDLIRSTAPAPAYPAPAYPVPSYPTAAYPPPASAPPALAGTTLPAPSVSAPSVSAPTGAPLALSPAGAAQTLRGLLRPTPTGTAFAECGSGQPLPIAPQGQGGQLEGAYQRSARAPGEEVLAEVEGRIAFGPLPGGTNLGRILIVERFVGLRPGEGCTPPATAWVAPASVQASAEEPELRNTYWRLTRVRNQSVTAAPGLEQPNLVLNPDIGRFSGSGGCNGIGGTFTLDDRRLIFDVGPSTLRACDGGMEQEQAYRTELARTVGWTIEGDRLSLYDAQGTPTLQFQAGYR